MDCKHQKTLRIPYFPGDRLACADCGELMAPVGYEDGMVRDYYVPGDPSFRRQCEVEKLKWLDDDDGDLEQCPHCCFVGTIDDFDVMGADEGNLFCNQCGLQFEQE